MLNAQIVILHNIISPYKTLLFNELYKLSNEITILYMAETESNREWEIKKEELKFPYEIMFKGTLEDVNPITLAIETYRRLNFYNPKIVIIAGYSYLACWTAFVWVKKNKRKVIAVIESHYLDRPRFRIKESVKKLFISNCDAALVDGTRHRDYVVSLGLKLEKIFIKKGTGPVDVSFYQREVSQFKSNKTEICDRLGIPCKNFLYIGRFSPEKNIIFLLKAYKRLKDEGVDWGLILVGNGPQRKEIDDFISRNNVKDIFLPGFKQKEEIPLFYAISNVFILPSISEPWGLVVSEAMACGLPVLVSNRCGCYPDIVQDGVNGFCFDPFDKEELYIRMKEIVDGKHDLIKMGEASLDILKDYTPERVAKVIVDTIKLVR